jgi:hypothetical protein
LGAYNSPAAQASPVMWYIFGQPSSPATRLHARRLAGHRPSTPHRGQSGAIVQNANLTLDVSGVKSIGGIPLLFPNLFVENIREGPVSVWHKSIRRFRVQLVPRLGTPFSVFGPQLPGGWGDSGWSADRRRGSQDASGHRVWPRSELGKCPKNGVKVRGHDLYPPAIFTPGFEVGPDSDRARRVG